MARRMAHAGIEGKEAYRGVDPPRVEHKVADPGSQQVRGRAPELNVEARKGAEGDAKRRCEGNRRWLRLVKYSTTAKEVGPARCIT
jgi:hypothetical protein